MFSACLRVLLSVILSPRRLLIAALLATFCYAALVATKARLFPERTVRAGKAVSSAAARSDGHGVPAPAGTRTE
jgi:hypothetical protein